MISYSIQGVSTFIFGPVLAILVLVLRFHANPPESHPVKSMANISKTVYQANMFLALSTYVASIIRITKVPPLAELSFIKVLGLYQFFIIVGAAMCQDYVLRTTTRKALSMYFYLIVGIILNFVVVFLNGDPSSKALILQQITSYCVTERDYPLSSGNNKPKTKEENKLLANSFAIIIGSSVALAIVVYLILKFFKAPIKRCLAKLKDYFTRFCTFLKTTPTRFCTILGVLLLTGYWLSTCVFLLWSMQTLRNDLQLSTGSAYQDAEWGFGQVTVMLLWLPLVHDIILECFGKNLNY